VPLSGSWDHEGISPLVFVNLLVKHWRATLGLPLAFGGVTALYTIIATPTYEASTTFAPELRSQNRLPSSLTGLAGQLGMSFGVDASESPRFYAEVLKSRELMARVLQSQYSDPRSRETLADSATLTEILGRGGHTSADSLDRAMRRLRQRLAITVDMQTNLVRLSVQSEYPELAATVANTFIEHLNEFNAQKRQSQARARRIFVEARIADGEKDLQQAEQELKTFYERNRSWQQAPQLVFEEGRLRRQVEIVKEVYLTLKREYEMARIEEVNDTPVLTVVDAAVPPEKPSGPKRRLWVLSALVLGGMVSVSWAFGAAYLERVRKEAQPEYLEFTGLLRRARRELAQAVRGLVSVK